MQKIIVEHRPTSQQLEKLGIAGWPIWTKEKSEFPWTYDEKEICYFINGKVIVTPKGESPIEIEAGDLVTFPEGLTCTWKILSDVKKHYKFG